MNLSHFASRAAAIAGIAVLGCILAPVAASAATVSEASGTLTYTAGAGEANAVTISPSNGSYVVKDAGQTSLVDGDGARGCTVSGNVATCPISGVTGTEVRLKDGNDTASISTPVPGFLSGGAGNDVLTGGAAADTLAGGDGADSLDGGPGPDALAGGAGKDTVAYASRAGAVDVDIDGNPDDGNADDDRSGVRDNVAPDVEDVVGGKGNDDLSGSPAANVLQGGPGNDDLTGLGGNDVLDDGLGTNDLEGGGGDDVLRQGATANAGDVLHGGDGTDTVSYELRTTPVFVRIDEPSHDGDYFSGENDDVGADVENLIGGRGDDWLRGSAAANRVDGGPGNDAISGDTGADRLAGGKGNDQFDGGAAEGADEIVGGLGTDTISYAARTAAVDVSLDDAANDGDRGGEGDNVRADVENVSLGSGNDRAWGDDDANVIDGGAGSDSIWANGGDDRLTGGDEPDAGDYLSGGEGSDVIRGQGGNDTLSDGGGSDDVDAGDGRDVLDQDAAPNGADNLVGGSGYDNLRLDNRTGDVRVSLDDQPDDGDIVNHEGDNVHADVESVFGGRGSDILVGNDGPQSLIGGWGNGADLLMGYGGDDDLEGRGGNDVLRGGAGNDVLDGDYAFPVSGETDGNDSVYGDNDNDTVSGNGGNDRVEGGDGNDTVNGNGGADDLYGGAGTDGLYGGEQDDLVHAKDGETDTVSGGNGNDTADLDRGCFIVCWDVDSVSTVEVKRYP